MSAVSPNGKPAALPPRPYHFPRFERRRLPNGIEVVVATVEKLPIVTVIALVDAGAVCDEPEREGIAQLTAALLLEGTTQRDGASLVDAFERLGASVEVSTDWDGAVLKLTAMSHNLGPAMELLGEVLQSPAFPEREIERLKSEHRAERMQLRTEPRGLADEMFSRFLYEPRSRFSRPEGGSEESVAAISGEQIASFYQSRYRPGAVTLVIAGDVAVDEGVRLAERAVGSWKGEALAPVQVIASPARRERAVHLVSKPQSIQSELRLGRIYLPRNHPDYHTSVVLNAVLGGLFMSRINLNLRERNGYTYGAFSSIDWRRQAGPFVVATAVENDVTAPATREAIGEIERMSAERVPDDELSLATSYLIGVFPIRFETTEAIASALAGLVRYGLTDTFFDTYRDKVRGVTSADVLRVAQQHLDSASMQLVVVGDLDAVREQIERLGYGDTTTYDTNGNRL
jgi:zinc protease